MAVIGCYTLDLYCDGGGEEYGTKCPRYLPGVPTVFELVGQTEGDCIKQAKREGWSFNREKTKAFCPKCRR